VSWLLLVADVLIVLVAAVFISANRKPSAAIAWILAIIFIPVLGLLLFLLVGFPKLPRKRRDKQREVSEAVLARTDGLDRVIHRDAWPPWLASMVAMNRNLGALPMVGGNSAELIDNYESSIKESRMRPRRRSSMLWSELAGEAFKSAYCPITSRSSCTRIANRRSAGSPTWERSIGPCCHCNRCEDIGADPISAITGSWLWWMAL